MDTHYDRHVHTLMDTHRHTDKSHGHTVGDAHTDTDIQTHGHT